MSSTKGSQGISASERILRIVRRPETGALAGTVAVYIFFAITGGELFTALGGTSAWLNVASELLLISLPVGLLMISGEFDLSVGAVMAGSAVMVALVAGYWGASPWLAVLAGWSVGLTTGLINGLLVTKTNVPSFIVTLAMQFFMLGLTLGLVRLITGDTTIRVETDSPVKEIFGGKFANQFENAIFWAIGFAIVLAWLLQKSRWGNWIFAIGGDPVSARAMGVQVEKTKVALFMFTGFGASTLGIVTTFLYNGTSTSAGQAYVFNSVIAVVLGGVLLTGGYGSVIGVIFGTLTFAIVNQGVYYTGWDSDWAALILGILLLIAVLMNNAFRRLALSGGSRKKEVKK